MYDLLPESRKDAVMRPVHSGRVCQPEEVAAAILWPAAFTSGGSNLLWMVETAS